MTDKHTEANDGGLTFNQRGQLVKISKFLCKILRHEPELIDIKPDKHGFVYVDKLLEKSGEKHKITREMLDEIVRSDPKKRYSYSADGTMIRCNYGHSYPVDLGYVELMPPELLYHGTAERFRESIEEKGVLPMSRQYVHLSADTETAEIVGRRHGKPVIFGVRAGEMFRQGHKFYAAVDKIWITDAVPREYLILPEELLAARGGEE